MSATRKQPLALVVEDDADFVKLVVSELQGEGFDAEAALDGRQARAVVAKRKPSVLVIDRKLPDTDGIRLLGELRRQGVEAPALILTGHPSLDSAIRALGLEAADYLVKPVVPKHVAALARGLLKAPTAISCRYLWDSLKAKYGFDHAFSASPAVQRCYAAAARVADSDVPVLIEGETGVGKEYLARAIHLMSGRADAKFVAVNCGAVPETLLESELFGYEKGAFTSAASRKIGLVEEADGGTLFLDEIGEMSPAMQVKLLRFLDDQTFRRLGSTELRRVNVRIIAATNRDLLQRTAVGEFREDLYYRLAVIHLYLPPLRERPEDIEAFARHFAQRFGEQDVDISPAAIEVLKQHDWPGNLRELANVVRRAILLRRGRHVEPEDIQLRSIGR
ncbi:MAG: sigma-54-dependent Fis family transcriptional regulator [Armatimonadetes bacterium]|nr:sigma-54-dependent Fis family transcriptional regulator [Armatimonadota bacterium]